MDLKRFEKDREIDPSQLDVIAATQADVFFYWAEQSVEARMEMERAKLKVELVEARLSNECRSNPENFGLVKITEAGIQAVVQAHDHYQDALGKYYRAREDSMLLDTAVNAMEQRKRMIEVLVTLHGQQYFAGPSVPRDLVSAYKAHREKDSESVTAAQRKRKRGE